MVAVCMHACMHNEHVHASPRNLKPALVKLSTSDEPDIRQHHYLISAYSGLPIIGFPMQQLHVFLLICKTSHSEWTVDW